jgi:hypothetical protein
MEGKTVAHHALAVVAQAAGVAAASEDLACDWSIVLVAAFVARAVAVGEHDGGGDVIGGQMLGVQFGDPWTPQQEHQHDGGMLPAVGNDQIHC